VPLIVLLGLGIAALTGTSGDGGGNINGGAAPITVPAPPHASQEAGPCGRLLAQLPLQLGRLQPRVVHTRPETPYVVAWGDPAVVLSCGVDRPHDLRPTSGAQYFVNGPAGGPYYDVTSGGDDANVWTTVDRGPYVAITVPKQYQGSSVLPPLSRAIARALPAVCSTDPAAPENKRCTRRP
jgi:hypothetical protein